MLTLLLRMLPSMGREQQPEYSPGFTQALPSPEMVAVVPMLSTESRWGVVLPVVTCVVLFWRGTLVGTGDNDTFKVDFSVVPVVRLPLVKPEAAGK